MIPDELRKQMRTEQELIKELEFIEFMEEFHIEVDKDEERKLYIEFAEWVIANRQGHDDEIRLAESIIKECRELERDTMNPCASCRRYPNCPKPCYPRLD